MTPETRTARRCADCATLVHDLSSMSAEEARAVLASGSHCVRYLHDADGNIVFGEVRRDAVVVPARALVSKNARQRWLALASIVALPVLLEACGPGDRRFVRTEDGGTDDTDDDDERERFEVADASVRDADADR